MRRVSSKLAAFTRLPRKAISPAVLRLGSTADGIIEPAEAGFFSLLELDFVSTLKRANLEVDAYFPSAGSAGLTTLRESPLKRARTDP